MAIPDDLLPSDRVALVRVLQKSGHMEEFQRMNAAEVCRGENPETAPMRCGAAVIRAHEREFLPLLEADRKQQDELKKALEKRRERLKAGQTVLVPAAEVDEIEYHIDPADYNGRKVPIAEQYYWVMDHMDDPGVRHADAPNTAAWTMLMHYRPSAKRREEFYKNIVPKLLSSRVLKDEQESAAEKAIADDAAMEVCEQFLLNTAQEV